MALADGRGEKPFTIGEGFFVSGSPLNLPLTSSFATDRPGAINALRSITQVEGAQVVNDLADDPERIRLAERVNENYAEGVSYRKAWMDDREESIRYFEHQQWPSDPWGNVNKIQITINRVKPTIETVMGIISRTKMMVALEGVGPEDAIKGTVFNAIFEMTTRKDGAEFIMHEALKESRKTGLGVCKETWDWRLDFPFGMPRLEFLKSSEVIIQPGAMGLQYEDANWMIHEKIYDTDELRVMFPEFDAEIQPDEQWLGGMKSQRPLWVTAHARRDLLRNRAASSSAGPTQPAVPVHGLNTTTLKEMWYKKFIRQVKFFALRDFDELNLKAGREVPQDEIQRLGLVNGEDFAEIPFATHQMRLAKVINDRLISDTPSPYGHNQFPFLFFKANSLDQYTYPASDIKYMVELQDMLNKIYSLVTDHAIRVTTTPILIDDNMFSPTLMEQVTKGWNWPGRVLPRKRGTKFEQVQQTPINEGLLLIARELSASLDELIGVHGDRVTQEFQGASGKALAELRLSADIFHQPKSNPIAYGLLWWASELRVKNIQHLMRQDTMIRIDDRLAKILDQTPHKAFIDQDAMGKSYYNINRPGMDKNGREINLNDFRDGEFDVKATLVADYAESKRSKAELALGLGKDGRLDTIDILRSVDWPDPEGAVERIDEKNSLLKMGQKMAEDPVLMAIDQNPAVRAEIEAYLSAKMAGAPSEPAPAQGVSS